VLPGATPGMVIGGRRRSISLRCGSSQSGSISRVPSAASLYPVQADPANSSGRSSRL
jgi:hypothetical protein